MQTCDLQNQNELNIFYWLIVVSSYRKTYIEDSVYFRKKPSENKMNKKNDAKRTRIFKTKKE